MSRSFLDALASLKPVVSVSQSVSDQTQIAEITIESISAVYELRLCQYQMRASCHDKCKM